MCISKAREPLVEKFADGNFYIYLFFQMLEPTGPGVPEYLFVYLGERAAEKKEKGVVLKFLDGSLSVDLLLLRASSGLFASIPDDCEIIFVESPVRAGNHILDLLYMGETSVESNQEKLDITELIEMLDLRIDILLEDTSAPVAKIETFHIINPETPDASDVNQIMMGNMNQNDTKMILNQSEDIMLSNIQKAQPKDRNKKIYICDFHPCVLEKLSFEGISKFKRHTHSVHSAKPLACPENKNGCTFRADDFSKLGNHVQGVHKDLYSENIVCEECHKAFPSQSYLKTHMQRMHKVGASERGKICPFCGEKKLQLNDHIMRAHKTQHFQCQYCPKKFKTSVQRRLHHNVHTGFKPYTCLNCDARFSRLHHRKSHLEKLGHTAGPVLKPDDHVDCRSLRVASRDGKGGDEVVLGEPPTQEEISQAIGVNCAQIIHDITLGEEELDF